MLFDSVTRYLIVNTVMRLMYIPWVGHTYTWSSTWFIHSRKCCLMLTSLFWCKILIWTCPLMQTFFLLYYENETDNYVLDNELQFIYKRLHITSCLLFIKKIKSTSLMIKKVCMMNLNVILYDNGGLHYHKYQNISTRT